MTKQTQKIETKPVIFFCESDIVEQLNKLVATYPVSGLDERKMNRSMLIRKAVKKFIEEENEKC